MSKPNNVKWFPEFWPLVLFSTVQIDKKMKDLSET